MKLGIMQPYLFPYIGYYQLMNFVDEFVIYDNIQYSKRGWINRNRILVNGSPAVITAPLRRASDFLNIDERTLSDDWPHERDKLLNRIRESYSRAPHFSTAYPIVESALLYEKTNLFEFILNSLNLVREYLKIDTNFRISSTVRIDHTLRRQEKVIAICKQLGASDYINPIGGTDLYDPYVLSQYGIKLRFLKTSGVTYPQFGAPFVGNLSVIDLMMFNDIETISRLLSSGFTLQ